MAWKYSLIVSGPIAKGIPTRQPRELLPRKPAPSEDPHLTRMGGHRTKRVFVVLLTWALHVSSRQDIPKSFASPPSEGVDLVDP